MMQSTFKHLKKVCFMNLLFAILFLTLGQASSAKLKKGTGPFLIETAGKTASKSPASSPKAHPLRPSCRPVGTQTQDAVSKP